jgi:nicotinate phosphoribosyltransferase
LKPRAVRLDSGDLIDMSRRVRAILDAGGLRDTSIFVSSDLHEQRIADIVSAHAPIDGFGVGGALTTASDAPALGAIYKLVEVERDGVHVPIMKLSPGKRSYPGRKQIWRRLERGVAVEDTIEVAERPVSTARASAGQPDDPVEPLLTRVMANGRRIGASPPLGHLRARCLEQVAALPASVRRLRDAEGYPVGLGPKLRETIDRLSHPR